MSARGHLRVLPGVLSVGPAAVLGLAIAGGTWLVAGVIVGGGSVLLVALTRFRWLLVLWVVGIPTLFVFPNRVLYAVATVLTLERLLFAALLGAAAVAVAFRRARLASLGPVDRAILIFLGVWAVSFASTVPAKTPQTLYGDLVMATEGLFMPFLAFALARSQPWGERELLRVFRALTGVGVYLGATGLLQYHLGVTAFLPTHLALDFGIDRATGSFYSPVEYGAVLCVAGMLTWWQLDRARDNLGRLLLLGSLTVMVAGIAASRTRAVWIALALAVVAVAWRRGQRGKALTVGLVLGTILLVLASSVLLEGARFEARALEWDPIQSRIDLYATSAQLLVHHPILGAGWGRDTFRDAKIEYVGVLGRRGVLPHTTHNEILFMLIHLGLAGTIPYLLIYTRGYRLVRDLLASRGGPERVRVEVAPFVRGVFVVVAVVALTSDLVYYTYLRILFFFLLGVLAAPAPPER